VRGCREVVRPGVNGLLVPARDSTALARAIERLLQSPQLRARLGRAGRLLAETEFAESVVVRQTLAVYRQLLDGRWPAVEGRCAHEGRCPQEELEHEQTPARLSAAALEAVTTGDEGPHSQPDHKLRYAT